MRKLPIRATLIAAALPIAIAITLWGGPATAKDVDQSFQNNPIDPSQGQTYAQRQRIPLSERKAAAQRLKAEFEEVRVQEFSRKPTQQVQGPKNRTGKKGGAK